MKIIFVKGDRKIGNTNYQYVSEDCKNIYLRRGKYSHNKKTIYVIKQNNIIITIYIIIHEFFHALIHYIFRGKNIGFMNMLLDKGNYIFLKYIIMYRPKVNNIINIY